jgi:hypothetical protein
MKYRGTICCYDTTTNHCYKWQKHKKIEDIRSDQAEGKIGITDPCEQDIGSYGPTISHGPENLLEVNNHGKRGRPCQKPNAFITFLFKLRAKYSVAFRSLEGITRIFARITSITTVCHTSIFRRIRNIVPTIHDSNGRPVECAIDSTGFKITISGDYLGSK